MHCCQCEQVLDKTRAEGRRENERSVALLEDVLTRYTERLLLSVELTRPHLEQD